jgi:hypothetical protein
MAVNLLDAVRRSLAGKMMPLDHAGEAAPLGDAGDVHSRDAVEDLDRELLADFGAIRRTANLTHKPLRFASSLGGNFNAGRGAAARSLAVQLGDMTTFAAASQAPGLVLKTELDRFVSVAIRGANLQHCAGADLEDGHRNRLSRLGKYLRHPDLAAEYSLSHRSCALWSVAARERAASPHLTREASVA